MGSHDKRLHCVLDWGYVGDLGMSGFKGTPGPWEVHQEDGDISIRQAGTTERGLGWSSYTQVAAELNNIHDTNLVAAAPELLESLQEVMAALTKLGFDGPAERKAQAAINKALGE